MKSPYLLFICLFLLSISLTSSAIIVKEKPQIPHPLWPIPTDYIHGLITDQIIIRDPCNFSFQIITNQQHPYQLPDIFSLYRKYIFSKTCKSLAKMVQTSTQDPNSILKIKINNPTESLMNLYTDESYSLTIKEGSLTLNAATYIGAVRGLETFSQLITINSSQVIIPATPINITDKPRFPHRGVMVDTSRHFIPKEKLFEIMDTMLSVKLNVLHWHITDSDSFPMYFPSHPNLSKFGAFSPEETYTEDDVKEIVDYAILRGIRIVPELDGPSHTTSWGLAPEYSNLLFCTEMDPVTMEVPDGQIDPTSDDTYSLMGDLFKDLKEYFPWDSVHLGSDEVRGKCWNNTKINNFMTQNNISSYEELFNYYVNRTKKQVSSEKRRLYWTNPDTNYLTFQDEDILQFWGTTHQLQSSLQNYPKNKFIMSNYDYLYLDCGTGDYQGQQSWCNPYHTWLDIYDLEPSKYVKAEDLGRILGLESAIWSEMNDASTVINKVFPRSCTLAERGWSAAEHSFTSHYAIFVRLNAWRKRLLSQRGIQVQPVSTGYCEKNPENCFAF